MTAPPTRSTIAPSRVLVMAGRQVVWFSVVERAVVVDARVSHWRYGHEQHSLLFWPFALMRRPVQNVLSYRQVAKRAEVTPALVGKRAEVTLALVVIQAEVTFALLSKHVEAESVCDAAVLQWCAQQKRPSASMKSVGRPAEEGVESLSLLPLADTAPQYQAAFQVQISW